MNESLSMCSIKMSSSLKSSSRTVCSVFNVNDEEVLKLSAVISQSKFIYIYIYPAPPSRTMKRMKITMFACDKRPANDRYVISVLCIFLFAPIQVKFNIMRIVTCRNCYTKPHLFTSRKHNIKHYFHTINLEKFGGAMETRRGLRI